SRRYGSARELADDLGHFLNNEPIGAHPIARVGKLWRLCQRRPAVALLSASVLLLLLVVAVGSTLAAWRVTAARRAEQRAHQQSERANRDLRATNVRLADTVSLLELQQAEDLFRAGDAAAGVAHLAAMLRHDPSNHVV